MTTDAWYNELYSANSECEHLPFPVPAAVRGIPDRTMCSRAAYRLTQSIDAGCAAVLVLNKHAGPVNTTGMSPLGLDTSPVEQDFQLWQFTSPTVTISNAGPLAANGIQNHFNDLINNTDLVVYPVPPVNGTDPRDLLQPYSRNGAYCFLGASMSLEVTTQYQGSATIFAADTNQNPKNWGDRGVSCNNYHPGPPVAGTGFFGDMQYVCPGSAPGTMRYPVPPALMAGLPQGGSGAPTFYSTFNATVGEFFGAYRSCTLPGNSHGAAYAQIAGDPDTTPGAGVLQPDAWGMDLMTASGEYPVCSTLAVLLASGCAICVMNTSTVPMTVRCNCTASWACPVDSSLPEYLNASPSPAHLVRDMSYLNTANCAIDDVDAVRKMVKEEMYAKMEDEPDIGPRIAAAVGHSIVRRNLPSVVSSAHTGAPMTQAASRSLLSDLWSRLKATAKDKALSLGKDAGKMLLHTLIGALGV